MFNIFNGNSKYLCKLFLETLLILIKKNLLKIFKELVDPVQFLLVFNLHKCTFNLKTALFA